MKLKEEADLHGGQVQGQSFSAWDGLLGRKKICLRTVRLTMMEPTDTDLKPGCHMQLSSD